MTTRNTWLDTQLGIELAGYGDPTPEERARFLNSARARRHGWHCFEKSIRRTALRIARTSLPGRTPMTAALPLDPARLADLLLTPATDANALHRQLADQIGPRPARRLLAAAHNIAAERLWAAAA